MPGKQPVAKALCRVRVAKDLPYKATIIILVKHCGYYLIIHAGLLHFLDYFWVNQSQQSVYMRLDTQTYSKLCKNNQARPPLVGQNLTLLTWHAGRAGTCMASQQILALLLAPVPCWPNSKYMDHRLGVVLLLLYKVQTLQLKLGIYIQISVRQYSTLRYWVFFFQCTCTIRTSALLQVAREETRQENKL